MFEYSSRLTEQLYTHFKCELCVILKLMLCFHCWTVTCMVQLHLSCSYKGDVSQDLLTHSVWEHFRKIFQSEHEAFKYTRDKSHTNMVGKPSSRTNNRGRFNSLAFRKCSVERLLL